MDGGVCPVSSVYMAPLGTVYWAVLRLTRWTVESVLCPWKVLSLHGAPSRPQFTGPPTWTGTSMGPWGRACLAVSQAAGIPQAHCLLPTLAQAARTMDRVVSGLSRLVHLIVLSLSRRGRHCRCHCRYCGNTCTHATASAAPFPALTPCRRQRRPCKGRSTCAVSRLS